jgi:NADH-quinone oxidoreductase subunit E
VQALLRKYPASRESLIPILQEIQEHERYLPEEAVAETAAYLDMTASQVYGVASFYAQFRFTRPGDHIIRCCQGTACHVRGGKRLLDEVSTILGIAPGETTPDCKFSLETVACFGSCALAPVLVVDDTVYGRMTATKARALIRELR